MKLRAKARAKYRRSCSAAVCISHEGPPWHQQGAHVQRAKCKGENVVEIAQGQVGPSVTYTPALLCLGNTHIHMSKSTDAFCA